LNTLCTNIIGILLLFILGISCSPESPIDREALVNRHHVENTSFDSLASLTVGNGGFAFTVDFTGLQTFPEAYSNGIPLGTQSDWGWHSFLNHKDYRIEETMTGYRVHEREVTYSVQGREATRQQAAADYFRVNPHRLHLGIVGFEFNSDEGEIIRPADVSEINQILDVWKGEIRSRFSVMGEEVQVITVCHPELDVISFQVRSKLISDGRLSVAIKFPYPSGMHADMACRWDMQESHSSHLELLGNHSALIQRNLDTTQYFTKIRWNGDLEISETSTHHYELTSASEMFDMSIQFSPTTPVKEVETFQEIRKLSSDSWIDFWESGGVVDFSGSLDPRAEELERRIILSQYLTRVQCAGSQPPQETGLTYNSWYGKFHLEMAWWHMVHFFLWNRPALMEENLNWYETAAYKAKQTAVRQGYKGIRWQKMTEPSGNDSPSNVGSFLIWQQPHFIYFAELYYRQFPNRVTLMRFRDLVFATADFMASYAWYNPEKERYELGPALIPAQECFDPNTTINPSFELSYWHWGLQTAIKWSERLGLEPNPDWVKVLKELSPLFSRDGLYLPAESVPLAYQEVTHMHDHPAVLGAFGVLPACPLYNIDLMENTFDFVWENWHWDDTVGMGFPINGYDGCASGPA